MKDEKLLKCSVRLESYGCVIDVLMARIATLLKTSGTCGLNKIMNDEYRLKLIIKLRTLVAVLKVTLARIKLSAQEPGADVVRLIKISDNLKKTLASCLRALDTLTRDDEKTVVSSSDIATIDEHMKFKHLPPITSEEIEKVDWAKLTEQFKG